MIKKSQYTNLPTAGWQDLQEHGNEVVANLPHFVDKYGDYICLSKKKKLYAIHDVEAIQYILKKGRDHFDKDIAGYQYFERVTGSGLLTFSGDAWFERRKLLQPFFTSKALSGVAAIAQDKTCALITRWQQKYMSPREPFSLVPEIYSSVLQVTAQMLFSQSLSFEEAWAIVKQFVKAQDILGNDLVLPPKTFRIKTLRIEYMRYRMDRHVKRWLAARLADTQPHKDMLDVLIYEDKHPAAQLTQEAIRNEVRNFLWTGHETTGSAIIWTMILLLQHPEAIEKIRKEVADVDALGGGVDVAQCAYLQAVFKESMRLYPPIWGVVRRLLCDDTIQGKTFPYNATMIMSAHVLHRDKRYWSCPDQFKPERFLGEQPEPSYKDAYFPFGLGARTCIANRLAAVVGPTILAELIRRLDFTLMSRDFKAKMQFSVRPRYPVFVSVEERH